MSRKTIAPEHKKFFQINGFIVFDALFTPDEMETLWKLIKKQSGETPGLLQENLYRSLPIIITHARKLGRIAAELLDKKPVRIAYDAYLANLQEVPKIEEREVGLLLDQSGKGLFFTKPSHLYKQKETCYFLLVFTANFVNNPIIFQ